MTQDPQTKIRSVVHTSLPRARIILAGSHCYGEATADSDYDLLVISTLPVGKRNREAITKGLSDAGIRYDIHFVPRLLILLKWKNIAGRDLDTGRHLNLRLTGKVRSEIFANRIKMAFYYFLQEQYVSSAISLFRAKAVRLARTDAELFSFAGNLALLERHRTAFTGDEYLLYEAALRNRLHAEDAVVDTRRLLELMNETFLVRERTLFQLQHNLQYWLRSWKAGRLRPFVNYNRTITRALRAFANGDVGESRRQLGKLVKVDDLEHQLREYSLLSIFEMEGGAPPRDPTPTAPATRRNSSPPTPVGG